LNDKGRVEVADKLGSAVDRIEGTLIAQNSDSYTIAISQVYQLGGNSSKWNGEHVVVAKDGTAGARLHRFNKTRTIILAAAITAALVVFLVTASLNGSSTGSLPGTGGTGPQTH
jgi:hypothetical protein